MSTRIKIKTPDWRAATPRISAEKIFSYLRLHLREILGGALLLLLVHDVFGAHGFLAMRRTQKEIQQVQERIGKLNQENKSLSGEVNALKTDPSAIERIAREEMGLARPGEHVYTLPDSAKPGDPIGTIPQK